MLSSCESFILGQRRCQTGNSNRQVWLYQPGKGWCRFSEGVARSWTQSAPGVRRGINWNAQGSKAGWGWRRKEWPGTRSCMGQTGRWWSLILAGRGTGGLSVPGLWCCSTERDTGSQRQPRVSCSRPFNTWLCNQGMLVLRVWCSVGDLSVLLGRRGHLQQRGFIRARDA